MVIYADVVHAPVQTAAAELVVIVGGSGRSDGDGCHVGPGPATGAVDKWHRLPSGRRTRCPYIRPARLQQLH